MIKLKTDLKHRFGKSVSIQNQVIPVSETGEIQVEESIVALAIECGFELVDKNAVFTSKEEQAKVKEMTAIIESANLQAKEIIATAEKQAEEIIATAQKEAEKVTLIAQVDEKTELKKKLGEQKVNDLRETLIISGYSQEEVNSLKKEDLINLIVEHTHLSLKQK